MKTKLLSLISLWSKIQLRKSRPIGVALFVVLTTNTLSAETINEPIDRESATFKYGKQIYRNGILPSGKPVTATVQGDVSLSGNLVTCEGCHKRSGLGSSESNKRVLPITKSDLYDSVVTRRTEETHFGRKNSAPRPKYDDKSLKSVIRDGIDPNGRVLDPIMPRFALNDKELEYLITYIKTLSSDLSPGVSDDVIQFATIITDDVDPKKSDIMLEVLNKFFTAKNANTRNETGRAKHSPWHKQLEYTGYRVWKLTVWHLNGEPSTWQKQLHKLYDENPIFAIVSGISTKSWQPVHEFCVNFEIPCLFPNTDLPKISDTDFYPVYFTKGLTLQAKILAKYLTSNAEKSNVLLQIYQNNEWGNTPAEIIKASTNLNDIMSVRSVSLKNGSLINANDVDKLIKKYQPTHIVFWLKEKPINQLLPALSNHTHIKQLFLPASILGNNYKLKITNFKNPLHLIYPYQIPKHNYLLRTLAWTKSKNIDPAETFILANTFFAVKFTIDAVNYARTNIYRDFVLEGIEHMADNMLTTSVFPRVSLGPNQRFVSKGGYIATYDDNQQLYAASEWIVP